MEKIHLRIFSRIVGEPFTEGTEYLADEFLEFNLYESLGISNFDRCFRAKF